MKSRGAFIIIAIVCIVAVVSLLSSSDSDPKFFSNTGSVPKDPVPTDSIFSNLHEDALAAFVVYPKASQNYIDSVSGFFSSLQRLDIAESLRDKSSEKGLDRPKQDEALKLLSHVWANAQEMGMYLSSETQKFAGIEFPPVLLFYRSVNESAFQEFGEKLREKLDKAKCVSQEDVQKFCVERVDEQEGNYHFRLLRDEDAVLEGALQLENDRLYLLFGLLDFTDVLGEPFLVEQEEFKKTTYVENVSKTHAIGFAQQDIVSEYVKKLVLSDLPADMDSKKYTKQLEGIFRQWDGLHALGWTFVTDTAPRTSSCLQYSTEYLHNPALQKFLEKRDKKTRIGKQLIASLVSQQTLLAFASSESSLSLQLSGLEEQLSASEHAGEDAKRGLELIGGLLEWINESGIEDLAFIVDAQYGPIPSISLVFKGEELNAEAFLSNLAEKLNEIANEVEGDSSASVSFNADSSGAKVLKVGGPPPFSFVSKQIQDGVVAVAMNEFFLSQITARFADSNSSYLLDKFPQVKERRADSVTYFNSSVGVNMLKPVISVALMGAKDEGSAASATEFLKFLEKLQFGILTSSQLTFRGEDVYCSETRYYLDTEM